MTNFNTMVMLLMLCLFLPWSDARVLIYNNATELISMYNDVQAKFGRDIPQNSGILGVLDVAKPANACLPIRKRSSLNHVIFGNVFLLVEESRSQRECSYQTQAYHAQDAGYTAMIVYRRHYSDDLIEMKGDGPAIIAVMVSKDAGIDLSTATYPTGSRIKIMQDPEIPFQLYLIPFVVVISICFLFMLLFSLGRYCRFRIRQRRSRLSPANLKKIPTKKFKKGDEYDICAICIEDYEENEKIRILPCNHAYHTKCVDPWLTAGKKLCPVCKQSVEPDKKKKKKKKSRRRRRERSYDQASTSSRNSHDESSASEEVDEHDGEAASERTPLLSGDNNVPSSGALNV